MTPESVRYRVCYMCDHGPQRSVIGVCSAQVTGGSSHPSEASYESGDYLWPSQCLESGTTLPSPATTARHQFYLNPVVTYEGNHQGSGSRKTKKKVPVKTNRGKNNFTYQQSAWPSFRKKQKSNLQESILIRWMMIPVSCFASSASPTPLLLPQKT